MDVKFYTDLDALYARGATREIEDFLVGELHVAEMQQDSTAQVTVLNELMGFYRVRHEFDDCRACCEQVLMLLEHVLIDEEADLATVYLNVATAYREMGDYDQAEALFIKVMDIYSKTLPEYDFRVATLYNNFSLMYWGQKRYKEAYAFMRKALDTLAHIDGLEKQCAVSHTNMAYLLMDSGEYDEALDYLLKGEALFEKCNATGTLQYASNLDAMGQLYEVRKDYWKAEEYYQRAANVIRNCLGTSPTYDEILSRLDRVKKINAGK